MNPNSESDIESLYRHKNTDPMLSKQPLQNVMPRLEKKTNSVAPTAGQISVNNPQQLVTSPMLPNTRREMQSTLNKESIPIHDNDASMQSFTFESESTTPAVPTNTAQMSLQTNKFIILAVLLVCLLFVASIALMQLY